MDEVIEKTKEHDLRRGKSSESGKRTWNKPPIFI